MMSFFAKCKGHEKGLIPHHQPVDSYVRRALLSIYLPFIVLHNTTHIYKYIYVSVISDF
jgi:hypothetical protein